MRRNAKMRIDGDLIRYLEELSCLALSEDERLGLTEDLRDILDGMTRLGGLDTAGVPERSHPFDNVNSFRDDSPKRSLERELVLRNAPEQNGEMLIAPKTVE